MPIHCKTPVAAIDNYLDEQLERRKKALIRNLCYVGERCRNEATNYPSGTFKDRTHHLRGSIGYVVAVDGVLYKQGDFGLPESPSEAKAQGAQFARSLVGKFPKGIVLIVVAGKTYAKYVSAKGYNVIDSAELLADRLVPKMLAQLGLKG